MGISLLLELEHGLLFQNRAEVLLLVLVTLLRVLPLQRLQKLGPMYFAGLSVMVLVLRPLQM